jgi:predicted dehydrogenase
MSKKLRVIVIGCGNMGSSHARSYHKLEGFDLVGLVDMFPANREKLAQELGGVAQYDSLDKALSELKPDVAAICTYPDSHAALARQCVAAGVHLFVEKPGATTVSEAEEIVELARRMGANWWWGTSCASTGVDEVYRDRPIPWQTVSCAEPEHRARVTCGTVTRG